jgi:hypothetical protein
MPTFTPFRYAYVQTVWKASLPACIKVGPKVAKYVIQYHFLLNFQPSTKQQEKLSKTVEFLFSKVGFASLDHIICPPAYYMNPMWFIGREQRSQAEVQAALGDRVKKHQTKELAGWGRAISCSRGKKERRRWRWYEYFSSRAVNTPDVRFDVVFHLSHLHRVRQSKTHFPNDWLRANHSCLGEQSDVRRPAIRKLEELEDRKVTIEKGDSAKAIPRDDT